MGDTHSTTLTQAYTINVNFNTCAIREALQNDPVKSRHVGPFVRTDRTVAELLEFHVFVVLLSR